MNPLIIDYFEDYSRILFQYFGDRVSTDETDKVSRKPEIHPFDVTPNIHKAGFANATINVWELILNDKSPWLHVWGISLVQSTKLWSRESFPSCSFYVFTSPWLNKISDHETLQDFFELGLCFSGTTQIKTRILDGLTAKYNCICPKRTKKIMVSLGSVAFYVV